MQAIDPNVLIYTEITSSQYHRQARQVLTELAEGIAALCIEHGVTELISADRDFLRFKPLRIINPFQ